MANKNDVTTFKLVKKKEQIQNANIVDMIIGRKIATTGIARVNNEKKNAHQPLFRLMNFPK